METLRIDNILANSKHDNMKAPFVLALLLCFSLFATSQTHTVYTLPLADSVKITNYDSSELILENHTQAIPGFLWNTGRGRTIFKRPVTNVNDSTYLIGADTLKVGSPNLNKNAWVQGLNSFGTTGKFGTRDKNNVEFYTNNGKAAVLDTFGNLHIGNVNNSVYKLDVGGQALMTLLARVTNGDAYDVVAYTNAAIGPTPYTVGGSLVGFGSVWGWMGVNKATFGNIPQGSLMIGQTSPFKYTTIVDYSLNPVLVVDGAGYSVINGGYAGIGIGGTVANTANVNSWNFQINGGRGTGAGIAGDIIIATGTSQPSGMTIHPMTNRWWIKGGTGYLANHDTATSSFDVRGATGYSQFRMRTTYTPSSTSDSNGNTGDFSWDSNYLYIKTPDGWKRSALTTF